MEQNTIEWYLKQEKIPYSKAKKYINEYDNYISDTYRNKRDVSEKQSLSEKLASVNINNKERKSEKPFKRETAMAR
ncbi:MAG: hypothetical protein IC227_05195 [Enterococcus lacertideformus]|uniref:Uncharacterized protein n=1 Tax=Enterococcus lacertideformus TaxID=2771493 RepID=A0A931B243_9ENTE|nr:hypothetical protein [Enterococcus lacertideformus]